MNNFNNILPSVLQIVFSFDVFTMKFKKSVRLTQTSHTSDSMDITRKY